MIIANDSLKTARETLVLAFELAGDEVGRAPERILEALRSPEVVAAIKATLERHARALLARQVAGQPLMPGSPKAVVQEAARAGRDAALAHVKQSIEQTPRYRTLMSQLEQLRTTAQENPLGLFIDADENVLFMTATIIAVGGLVALYETGSGDSKADVLTGFLNHNKDRLAVTVGALQIGLGQVQVKPSERSFDLELIGHTNLKRITGDFQLRATAKDGRLSSAGGRYELSLPLERGSLSTYGSLSGQAADGQSRLDLEYALGLRLTLNEVGGNPDLRLQLGADVKGNELGGSAGANVFAGMDRAIGRRGSLSFGLTGSYNHEWSDFGPDRNEGRLELGLSIRL